MVIFSLRVYVLCLPLASPKSLCFVPDLWLGVECRHRYHLFFYSSSQRFKQQNGRQQNDRVSSRNMCGASLVAAFSSCLCREAARPPGESGRPDGVDQQGRTWSYFNSKAARSSSAWPRERGFEHQRRSTRSNIMPEMMRGFQAACKAKSKAKAEARAKDT